MTATPRATVVIPAHNAGRTIARTLRSLAGQSWADWEAVVIDDGSTDDTAAVIEAVARGDSRIRLLRQSQGGVSRARNAGLAAGRGEWVLFLDADDEIRPEYFQRMFDALDADPSADAAYCGYCRVPAEGEPLPATFSWEAAGRPFPALARHCVFAIHCAVVRRQLVIEVGGFEPDLSMCEDWDLWQRVARTGARFVGVPEPLALYNMQPDSLSSDMALMAATGLEIMERAWRPDPRVPRPDPRYADGPGEGDLDEARTWYALWCAAAEASAGRDAYGWLDGIGALVDVKDLLPIVHSVIRDAVLIGAQVPEEKLLQAWAGACRHIAPFLARLEAASTRPNLARRILYTFELPLLRASELREPAILATTMGLRVDIGDFRPIVPPPGVDTAHLRFHAGEELLMTRELPLWGALPARDLAGLALAELGFERLFTLGGYESQPGYRMEMLDEKIAAAMRSAASKFSQQTEQNPASAPDEERQRALARFFDRLDPETAAPSDERKAEIISESRARVWAEHPEPFVPPAEPGENLQQTYVHDRAFWETLFETPNPWGYDSRYEQLKYEQTLSLIDGEPIGRALELACAEGHFTVQVAPKVGRLVAADISQRALERAAERCRERTNIDFRQIDLVEDELPGGFDLTFCTEVLYYMKDEAALRAVAAKLRDTLAPGGRLIHAHAHLLCDAPGRTGFDWDNPFGGETIARILGETAGLALERTLSTELYRIDMFRRVESGMAAAAPAFEQAPFAMPKAEVQRSIVWGGAVVSRMAAFASERTEHVPVLMYHRIAEDGPEALAPWRISPAMFEAQLRLLRRHGYYSITSPQLEGNRGQLKPFPGRPVLISFDDAYRDFHEFAWPILYRNDFRAEVFVVTDKVGGHADWDAEYGPPAPLMGWEEMQALQAQGAFFGSHLATHRIAESLTSEEVLVEAVRSRTALQIKLGDERVSFASPFGNQDERFTRIMREAGYRIGFSTEHGTASFPDDALGLPRIDVSGHWTLDDFAAALGLSAAP